MTSTSACALWALGDGTGPRFEAPKFACLTPHARLRDKTLACAKACRALSASAHERILMPHRSPNGAPCPGQCGRVAAAEVQPPSSGRACAWTRNGRTILTLRIEERLGRGAAAFLSSHSVATLRPVMSHCAPIDRLMRISVLLMGLVLASASLGQPNSNRASRVYDRIPVYDEHGREQIPMFRAWNPDPVGNHPTNLRVLEPTLARIVRRAQAAIPDLRFVIGSGRREREQQRQAVAWGWSLTQSTAHRTGRAVDLWPLDLQGRVVFDPALQNRIAAAMKAAASRAGVRIRWGGHFRGYQHQDRSHFELVSRRRT
jgi:peptidoglycan L-alanyl-D-glutamate endopeptidase CwlK